MLASGDGGSDNSSSRRHRRQPPPLPQEHRKTANRKKHIFEVFFSKCGKHRNCDPFASSISLFSSFFLLFVLRFIFSTLFFEIQSDKAHTNTQTQTNKYTHTVALLRRAQSEAVWRATFTTVYTCFGRKMWSRKQFFNAVDRFQKKIEADVSASHSCCSCARFAVRCIWWCHQPHIHTHTQHFFEGIENAWELSHYAADSNAFAFTENCFFLSFCFFLPLSSHSY